MTSRTSPSVGRTRLSPDQRREQLLDQGVQLLSTRSLDEVSIDVLAEHAGVSRGLLYHYFGGKQACREAVVRRAADDLVAQTVPPAEGDMLERLLASVAAYVDFVDANYAGYLSFVRGAKGGDPSLRQIYDEAFGALTDRIFAEETGLLRDTPETRLVVRGWQAMTEEIVLAWKADPGEVSRDRVLELIAGSLPALFAG